MECSRCGGTGIDGSVIPHLENELAKEPDAERLRKKDED
jgi:hypothetical protein